MAAGEKTTGRDRLSEQEGQVLVLVVEGKANKEIAASLNLSGKTVKNHRATIFQEAAGHPPRTGGGVARQTAPLKQEN